MPAERAGESLRRKPHEMPSCASLRFVSCDSGRQGDERYQEFWRLVCALQTRTSVVAEIARRNSDAKMRT